MAEVGVLSVAEVKVQVNSAAAEGVQTGEFAFQQEAVSLLKREKIELEKLLDFMLCHSVLTPTSLPASSVAFLQSNCLGGSIGFSDWIWRWLL